MKDIRQTTFLSEKYFHTRQDPGQMQATKENGEWILRHIPECVNIIKAKNKVIGYSFVFPCTKTMMDAFLKKRLTENELFEEIKKKAAYANFDCIYLCAAFVKPTFRGKGLGLKAFTQSIKFLSKKRKIKPVLFAWPFTREGEKLCEKIAQTLKLPLKERK